MSMDLFRQLLEAQRIAQADLLRRRGVVGVAIGYRSFKEQVTDQLAMAGTGRAEEAGRGAER